MLLKCLYILILVLLTKHQNVSLLFSVVRGHLAEKITLLATLGQLAGG